MTDNYSWRENAKCATLPHQAADKLLYPTNPRETGWTPGITYCQSCPVIEECLLAGKDDPHGVWGGQTPAQRKQHFSAIGGHSDN